VLFDGKDVSGLAPKDRGIAQVFQFPVIYDSMNVARNLGFPLKNDGMSSGEIRKRVEEIADLLELRSVLKYKAGQLTAGEKQRVSLGRGIVRTNTAAVLLDEPLTVIDPQQKWELRRKLKQVQEELNLTMIYVTHDQQEALTFADHVTVMKDGNIEQTGSPDELYATPETPFIGFFIGSPGMNFLEVTAKEGRFMCGEREILLEHETAVRLCGESESFTLGIRPEHVDISSEEVGGSLAGTVRLIEDTGAYKILTLEGEGIRLKARVAESTRVSEGEMRWVSFPGGCLSFFKGERKVG